MAIHNVKGAPDLNKTAGAATAKSGKTAKPSSAANSYAKAATAPTVKDAANVQISPRAKEMSMARQVAEKAPDVDEAKIAKYKSLVANGSYKPNPGKIADGIAREALLDEYATNQG